MKRFFLALSLLVSVPAFASEETTIAKYVVNLEDNFFSNYAMVELKQDAHLQVTIQSRRVGDPVIHTITKELNPRIFNHLFRHVVQLSNAEIKTTRQDVVCMMIAPPGPSADLDIRRGYDYETKEFTGELVEVSDGRGCWSHTHNQPTHEHDRHAAEELKGELRMLVMDLDELNIAE